MTMLRRLTLALILLAVSSSTHLLAATPAEALRGAADRGSPALLLVTDPANQNLGTARSTVIDAAKRAEGCVTVELDRSDAANAELVTKYRLAEAPTPLILVFAGNGAFAGGVPSAQATPSQVAEMFPTPKKAELLQAVQSGNAVLLVASRKSMRDQPKVVESCALACGQTKGKSVTVQVDLDDSTEARFLRELRIDAATETPVTLVVNHQGQITGSFNGPVEVATLVQAATKKAGGCCPKGSDKGCAKPQA